MMTLYLHTDFPVSLSSHAGQHELGRLVLKRVLRECLPFASNEELEAIEITAHGKPYLSLHPEICFNISHCSEAVAVVISNDRRPVGVDVQTFFPYREALARRICTRREWRLIEEAEDETEQASLLQQFWCRKEAVLKCIGCGLTVDLRTVDTIDQDSRLHYDGYSFSYMEYAGKDFRLCACECEASRAI